MTNLRVIYGEDQFGFYWSESSSKRKEYLTAKRNHPAVAEAVYQCNPGALEGDIFRRKDLRYYLPPRRLVDGINANLEFVAGSDMIVQVWDTAFSARNTSDPSACITAMLMPCNKVHVEDIQVIMPEEDPHYDIYVLDVFHDRIDFGDLVHMGDLQYRKWRPSTVLVEKKASGEPLMQVMVQHNLPVMAAEATMGKRARAVHGVQHGSAQGWVQQHRVFLPQEAPWLDVFVTELVNFSGAEDALDNQVDAFVHLCNFAITQGSGAAMLPSGFDTAKYAGITMAPTTLEEAVSGVDEVQTQEICQFCRSYNSQRNFCLYHQRPTTAFDTCESFDNGQDSYPL